ncbi:MAG: hypothetical protein ACRC50_06090 [Gaiella sp.]
MSDPAVASSRMIGEIFVERGLVTREQLDDALRLQSREGGLIGEILVAHFGVSRVELATVLAEQWRAIDHASGDTIPSAPTPVEPDSPNVVALPSPEPEAARRPIGEIFVESGAITEADLARALETQRATGERLGEILVAQGSIGRLELASALAEQWSELQVIRPPQPKQPEPWQEAAIREAQTPAEPQEPPAVPPAAPPMREIAALVDAVSALDERVTELSRRQLPDIDAVRAEASAVAARLEEVGSRVAEAASRPALDDLRTRVDGLSETVARVGERTSADAELQAALDRLAARVDELARPDADERIDALDRAIGDLRARLETPPATDEALRDDVRRLEKRLGELDAAAEQRLTSVDERLRVLEQQPSDGLESLRVSVAQLQAAVAAREGLVTEAQLEEALARLAAALRVEPSGEDSGEIARLDAALGELTTRLESLSTAPAPVPAQDGDSGQLDGVWSALEALHDRLDAPGVAEEELRSALDELRARVDRLGAVPDVSPIVQRVAALEHAVTDTSAVDEIATGLDVLARGAARREDVDALRGELAADLDGLRHELGEHVRHDRDAALEPLLAQLSGRLGALEAAVGARPSDGALTEQLAHEHEAVAELRARLGELIERVDVLAPGSEAELHPDAVNRAELAALAGDLSRRLDVLGLRLDDGAHSERIDAIDRRVTELAAAVDDAHGRLGEVAALAQGAIGRDEAAQRLAERVESSSADLSALLDQRLAEAASRFATLEHAVAETRSHVDRVTEATAGSLRAELEARLTSSVSRDELDERLVDAVSRGELEDRFASSVSHDELDARLVDAVTRGELDQRLADAVLRAELDERLASSVSRGELDGRLHDLVARTEVCALAEELGTRIGAVEGAGTQLGGRLDAQLEDMAARVEQLRNGLVPRGELVEATTGLDTRLTTLERSLGELDGRAMQAADDVRAALHERLAGLVVRSELDDVWGRVIAGEETVADLTRRTDALATRDELHALTDDLDRRAAERQHAAAAETTARLDALAADLGAGLAALHTRVDELAAGLGHAGGRLVVVEQALPEPGLVEQLRARVDEVQRQVAEEVALGDERARTTERALRKGLAGLGERLVATEQAYVDAGSALRRSIERLGAAVVEADARLADEPLDPPAVGYVAFVPTADGYRLMSLDGPVPVVGDVVETDQLEGQHRVTRVTRSPLPLDRRACAYLERVA